MLRLLVGPRRPPLELESPVNGIILRGKPRGHINESRNPALYLCNGASKEDLGLQGIGAILALPAPVNMGVRRILTRWLLRFHIPSLLRFALSILVYAPC